MPASRDASDSPHDRSDADSAGAGATGYAVHVRFSPSQGRRLRRAEPTTCGDGQALWTERPLLLERGDGSYELIGTSTHLDGLARWVLSHGADATVQGPDRLRRRVAAEARQVWRQYADDE